MINKLNTIFECSKCGAQSTKWAGRCLECGAWGSLEEVQSEKSKVKSLEKIPVGKVINFSEITGKDFLRIETGIGEFDQVLGGGIVPGSLILLGGEPGIGKSTLVAQLAAISKNNILYVSGEESAEQIKMRLDRLKLNTSSLQFLGETNIDIVSSTIRKINPSIAIVDSIQTMATAELPSEAGSVSQVRACTVKLLEVAKTNNIPIFIIGHVTKDGQVAGPKTLEHLVDTVLYLEGDRFHAYRLLRTVKNRFGSTDEVGIFEMTSLGLTEVKNPSALFLEEKNENLAGSATTCVMEGTRPLLVEIQSLVAKTYFGYPQRRSAGFDLNRLQLLIAVLDKRAKINLGMHDVHLNVAGGYKIQEPACDLAVAVAIASALKNKPIPKDIVVFGEIGLGGEIRSTSQIEKRINEAEKMGFNEIITPNFKKHGESKIKVTVAKNIEEVLRYLEI
ncbi:DNA repair protein RadA [Candidatus Falkowbacteria bacterium RIFOXYB2_FULL_38_15]|uniref:DNA repair protein RadA n=1 Tax=Candidatus Falkowbacteria bacterium RIFOXYA2_FULL_38_12 TaxID=1797993 RepID=A0A1F5S3E6_9BACT|nr:MAG: DNA repair protein RadA [Candidatus Falkowbacteria bacterium RIFOXYA2_FULL_38_12]OGF32649.1 MAG: DNA repair protein RadA [Candidatus Falkowbacteria bacterium RIFOXYB2_FULL_38_15]OGF44167.1 MAG: DNA repair protein RadA [Candidatus Falkowbacteria bacterium RIFOXYD2_FULL_39_16]